MCVVFDIFLFRLQTNTTTKNNVIYPYIIYIQSTDWSWFVFKLLLVPKNTAQLASGLLIDIYRKNFHAHQIS
jgi:hypothetical protein